MELRRAGLDLAVLHSELFESDLGQLRIGVVVQVALSVIPLIAIDSDDPGAQLAAKIAAAPAGPSYDADDFIRQRDLIASETILTPSEVDQAVVGARTGLEVTSAVASISAAYVTDGAARGVLLGAAVAIIYLLVRRRPG